MAKKIPYGRQWIDADDIRAVVKTLKSDWLTQGPAVEAFENAVAKYCKAKYAVAFSSATSALYCAYKAVGIGVGDEVITTPLTFAATSNMVYFCGGVPVFADIEKESLNINPAQIIKKITPKTKAIATVDFGGNPCDYGRILKIAKDNKLAVIEDASHALGAKWDGKMVGSFADMTVLSFHPVKLIATGEGGMVLTNSAEFYEKLKTLRSHGMVKKPDMGGWYYEIPEPSFNFRITDIQSALGLSQFKKLGKFIKRRREIVTRYQKAFAGMENLIVPKESLGSFSAWHIFPVQIKGGDRRDFFDYLHKNGIGAQVHYIPLNLQPFFQKQYGYKAGDFPVAEEYYKNVVTLPLFPKMTAAQINKVIKVVKNYT